MTPPTLASLPAELLEQILGYLPAKDVIFNIRLVNKLFHDIYSQSAGLNRNVEIELAGLEWNALFHPDLASHQAASPPPAPSQLTRPAVLSLLDDRERAWSSFDPKFRSRTVVDHLVSGVYDVVSGHYLLGRALDDGEFLTAGIKALRLPGRGDEGVVVPPPDVPAVDHPTEKQAPFVWKDLHIPGKVIVDFGMAIEEHDLIALVTACPCQRPTSRKPSPHIQSIDPNWDNPRFYPHPTNAILVEDHYDTSPPLGPPTNILNAPNHPATGFYSLQIHLVHFSTGRPHQDANEPILPVHVYSRKLHQPSISVRIVGENLAIAVHYDSDPLIGDGPSSAPWNGMIILDWKRGYRKSPWIPVMNTGGVFIAEDLLLCPNVRRQCLDVYHIDPSDPESLIPGPAAHEQSRATTQSTRNNRGESTASSTSATTASPAAVDDDAASDSGMSEIYNHPDLPSDDDHNTEEESDYGDHSEGSSTSNPDEVVELDEGDDGGDWSTVADSESDSDDSTLSSSSDSDSASDRESVSEDAEDDDVPAWLAYTSPASDDSSPKPRMDGLTLQRIAALEGAETATIQQSEEVGVGPSNLDDAATGKVRLVKRLMLPYISDKYDLVAFICEGEPGPGGLDRAKMLQALKRRTAGGDAANVEAAVDDTPVRPAPEPKPRLPYANPTRAFTPHPSRVMMFFQLEFVKDDGEGSRYLEFMVRREELEWFVRGFGKVRPGSGEGSGGIGEHWDAEGMGFEGCYCGVDVDAEEYQCEGERVRRKIEKRMRTIKEAMELEKREEDREHAQDEGQRSESIDKGRDKGKGKQKDEGGKKAKLGGKAKGFMSRIRKSQVDKHDAPEKSRSAEKKESGDNPESSPAGQRGRGHNPLDALGNIASWSKKWLARSNTSVDVPSDAFVPPHLPLHPHSHSHSRIVYSYYAWGGPWLTRWFNCEEFSREYVTTTCGERFVRILDRWYEFEDEWFDEDGEDDVYGDGHFIGGGDGWRAIMSQRENKDAGEDESGGKTSIGESMPGGFDGLAATVFDGGSGRGSSLNRYGDEVVVHEESPEDDENWVDEDSDGSGSDGSGDDSDDDHGIAEIGAREYGIVLCDFNEARVGREIMKRKELAMASTQGDSSGEGVAEPYLGWMEEEKCYKRIVVGKTPSSTWFTSMKERDRRGDKPVWRQPELVRSEELWGREDSHRNEAKDSKSSGEMEVGEGRKGESSNDKGKESANGGDGVDLWNTRDAAFLAAMQSLTKHPLYADDLPSYKAKATARAGAPGCQPKEKGKGTKGKRGRRDRSNEFNDGGVFKKELISSLPYVEIVSKDKFNYHAISIDEERILGFDVEENGVSSPKWFDTLYFG